MLLTNVSLEHTEVLGDTTRRSRGEVAVAHAARVVPAGQPLREMVPKSAEIVTGDARRTAEIFLGRKIRLSHASASRGASSGADESSGTARTPRPAQRGSASASTSRSRSPSLRSWPTRMRTPCSTTWPRSRRASSQPRPTIRARYRPSNRAARAEPHFPQVEIEPDPPRARACATIQYRVDPRDGLSVSARKPG